MRLDNSTTSIEKNGTPGDCCTYADIIALIVNTMPKGCTLQQMRLNIAILEKCDLADVGSVLVFSAAETTRIRESLRSHVWGANHPDLVAFDDAVAEADR